MRTGAWGLLPFILVPCLAAPAQTFRSFPLPGQPDSMIRGPDGHVWICRPLSIDRVEANGALTSFALPIVPLPPPPGTQGPPPVAQASGLGAGPDGNLWFFFGSNISRLTMSGSRTDFPGLDLAGGAVNIVAGSDGNLWFGEPNLDRVARITTTGVITEFSLAAGSTPSAITPGSDGALWFVEHRLAPSIGRITTAGAVTEFALPSPGAAPFNLATGGSG